MQASMVSVDREGNWPNLTRQGQGGSVMSVRVLLPLFIACADSLLELLLGLAQVMEQARQLSVILPLEASSELFRPARHTQEVFNQ
jgi:hypothetical protein